jgi:4-amino-4-deoxy-L-arabinose transferase-like glycosyltransferase
MNWLRQHLSLLLFILLLSGFVFVTAQRLGDAPLPETDEAFTLQVPYEMLNRGHLALPMFRFLGGNIETNWHSYTPIFFVWLWSFFKIFGYGLLQGRIFNLLTAGLTLLMVWFIGRRFIHSRAGLIATTFLVSDLTFLERSRMLRNDYAAAFFGLLAFYLYERAEVRQNSKLFLASGLAAGAGVMCHTNLLYILGAIGLLMLLREGWRIFLRPKLYQFGISVFVVMAYEIIYDIIDYKNFALQNRADSLHFSLFEASGIWQNITSEAFRYHQWFTAKSDYYGIFYGDVIASLPRTLNHIFVLLTAIAIIYLLIVTVKLSRRKVALRDHRVSIFIITIFCALFHTIITGHKEIYYFAHLAPWYALSVAIMLNDGYRWLHNQETTANRKLALRITSLAILLVYGFLLVQQNVRYYQAYNNPHLATFDEFKIVLHAIVPEGVCPVAKRSPVIWLAFEEDDLCFASIEGRMKKANDIRSKEYVFITPKKNVTDVDIEENSMRLIGVMANTPYNCDFLIYYTGTDSRYTLLEPKRYQFNGLLRGYSLIPNH